MVIIYDCNLTEPPSSIHCFRDVTLYSNVFLKNDNLLKCPKGMRSMYWKWIKSYGAHDFVQEIIAETEEQEGLTVGENELINLKILNEFNYYLIIEKIKSLS